ncbi:MAG: hypothetical protein WCS99_14040 [Limisphaerales bacterium]
MRELLTMTVAMTRRHSANAPQPGKLLNDLLQKSTEAELLATLACSRSTLRKWRSGERQPSGAAMRLIWLVHRVWHGDAPKEMADFLGWIPPRKNADQV